MKKYSEFLAEDADQPKKPVVFAFGRMNPPTTGHVKLVDKVHELAKKHSAYHQVVLSASQDKKKNPLSVSTKVKHAKRFFPHTNIKAASSSEPTLMHHAARYSKAGHDHLIMVAGSDRVEQYSKLLHTYNGKPDKSGKIPYSFKKIDVVSAGERDPDSEGAVGMSATKMREHASKNNFKEFRKGVPSHVSHEHAKELFHDVRKSMGHE